MKHLLAPGAGYEALIYYGARNLQDKIIFATGWGTQMVPLHQLVAETDDDARALVRDGWFAMRRRMGAERGWPPCYRCTVTAFSSACFCAGSMTANSTSWSMRPSASST